MNSPSTRDAARCIQDCLTCFRTCLAAAMNFCLEAGGRHIAPVHIRLMTGCADVCRTTAAYLLSSTPFYEELCRACAAVCEACAADCDSVGKMDDCAEACRRCAESCRQMVAEEVGQTAEPMPA
ncbi:ferredoxin [Tahibacter amnicola]|uniref:Ferredoxin n=1 Tax=Tahibacter amnicola TaxID=2976241 RepID=A0ABY6BGG0_9GAMM|nr:ferredoxin [Tahibacter amnicola]UXI68954.1 ferredoxin [Tahibacter amnicola]